MRMTKEGLALIRRFESCALTAYQDQGRIWTIGWGHTKDVQPGDTCDQLQADAWLLEDAAEAERLILAAMGDSPITDNQLSALVSFVYNIGPGKRGQRAGLIELKSGQPSTLLKCLRKGDIGGAADEFPKWDFANGMYSEGLLKRRMAEQSLFLTPEVKRDSTSP